jgi:hypothetical protein
MINEEKEIINNKDNTDWVKNLNYKIKEIKP